MWGQVISIKAVDSETLQPIKGVKIISTRNVKPEQKPILSDSASLVDGKIVATTNFNGRATIPVMIDGKVFLSHSGYRLKQFEEEKEQEKYFSFIPALSAVATCFCMAASPTSYASEHTAIICLEKETTQRIWNPDMSDPGLGAFSISEM